MNKPTRSSPLALKSVKATLGQLDLLAPRFNIDANCVKVLTEPSEFYTTIKIKNAKSRVFLASLYIGSHEQELIQCLDSALKSNPDLRVELLTDALRSTREPTHSCASLVSRLLVSHDDRVQIRMYHTPNLTGLKKAWIPARFNEAWGLQHMKIYGFDDEVLLSGANLSTDYFTNRQDRYLVLSSAPIANYFHSIFTAISNLSFSLKLDPVETSSKQAYSRNGLKLVWQNSGTPNPLEDPGKFRKSASRALAPLLQPSAVTPQRGSTFVYPVSQFTPLLQPDTSTEFPALSRIFSMLKLNKLDWTLTAGYFNVHPTFTNQLMDSSPSFAQAITAAPQANGFFESKGVSRLLPGVYTCLARDFVQRIQTAGKGSTIHFSEWQRGVVNKPGGWSYHAKGIWVSEPGQSPFMTVVGSSNYTRRAYTHDLECNAIIVTQDPTLQRQLEQEKTNLTSRAQLVGVEDLEKPERRPTWTQRMFAKFMCDKL